MKNQPDEDLILLGCITRPQGHRGAVRMLPEFDPLDQFEGLKTDELILRKTARSPQGTPDERRVHVEGYFFHQQFVILELQEVPDMNEAERIREMDVFVPREDLWDLEEGQFLAHDLEGFAVVDAGTNSPIGTVKTIQPGAAHDFICVRTEAKREILVPFVHAVVKQVDPATKEIRVDLPPGLDEL